MIKWGLVGLLVGWKLFGGEEVGEGEFKAGALGGGEGFGCGEGGVKSVVFALKVVDFDGVGVRVHELVFGETCLGGLGHLREKVRRFRRLDVFLWGRFLVSIANSFGNPFIIA